MNGKVLIVDDDPSVLRLLEKHLAAGGYEILSAANGAEALQIVLSQGPATVITDWMMPEMDGLQLCRAIRSSEGIGFVYVIMLTASADKARLVEAFEAGVDDFLSKPVDREELLARLTAATRILDLEENLAKQNRALCKANADMAVLNQKLKRMATTDTLTGLANRRQAMIRLRQHWAVAERYNQPLACIVADIDHFKQVNDTYGHDVGDIVLREAAKTLDSCARVSDTVCRLGGEEFLILCPSATSEMAATGAERLRQAVEVNRIRCNDLELTVTMSMGVAERDEPTNSPDDLLKHADDALYAAKRAGRNRVCIAGDG
jgi:two-component system cell cycle response regulator